MSEQLKIVYYEGVMRINDIREDAMSDLFDNFRIGCKRDILLADAVDFVSDIRYLENAKFSDEESRLLTYEEVKNAHCLLCWCEEIIYDQMWAEEDDSDNSISDNLEPCFVLYGAIFTNSGEGDIGYERDYNKVKAKQDGSMFGKRFWTGGKKPTFEQMKSKKWEGLEGYEYE